MRINAVKRTRDGVCTQTGERARSGGRQRVHL